MSGVKGGEDTLIEAQRQGGIEVFDMYVGTTRAPGVAPLDLVMRRGS